MSNTKTPWYSIRRKTALAAAVMALAGGPSASFAEVHLYGEIGESYYGESIGASEFVRDIERLDVDNIALRINSIGGSCPDGIAMYNALKRHRAHIHVIVDGVAASIASLIAMAGDTVEMPANALLMIHGPSCFAGGNAMELRSVADMLDVWSAAMATSYTAKSGLSQDEVVGLLTDGADHWYTAAEAMEVGFANTITDAVPVTASLDLSRFKTLPAAAAAFTKDKHMPFSNPGATGTPAPAAGATLTPAAAAPSAAVESELIARGAQLEVARVRDIRAAFSAFSGHHGVADVLTQCEADPNVTMSVARERLLNALGGASTPVAGHVVTVEDETDKFRSAAVTALLVRAGVVKGEAANSINSNPYRGYKLLDFARASLERSGVKMAGADQMKIVGLAFTQTTSDFPVLLEDAMHKALLTAWGVTPDTWTRFCAVGTVSDFRAHNRYRIGSLGNLDPVTEAGEFKTKSIPDGERASVGIGMKGNIINLSRQAMINDDLSAFIGLATMQGRAAKRTVEADVYALLASNPVLADGYALYSAEHGNLLTGAAVSVAAFDAARVAMGSQKDVSKNDFLDIAPSIWLGPIGMGGAARVINGAQYDPDTANKLQMPNRVAGMFRDIVDTARLTGNAWYTFADPATAPVIEVDFLDGNQEPFLEQQTGFTVDGTAFKVRLDFGVTAVDYRGSTKNPGA